RGNDVIAVCPLYGVAGRPFKPAVSQPAQHAHRGPKTGNGNEVRPVVAVQITGSNRLGITSHRVSLGELKGPVAVSQPYADPDVIVGHGQVEVAVAIKVSRCQGKGLLIAVRRSELERAVAVPQEHFHDRLSEEVDVVKARHGEIEVTVAIEIPD